MHYDVIIVGGGLVGAGLACALKSAPLKIALIDAKLPSKNDPRLFALNASSCDFLKNIGLWEALSAHATPIHQVHVSRKAHFGTVRLAREDVGLDALGQVIPAYQIEIALQDMLKDTESITTYQPATVLSVTEKDRIAAVQLQQDEQEVILTAPIVVGADGADSIIRKAKGFAVETFDYQQSALVTRVTLKDAHQHVAYERFTPNGAIAMLPLKNNDNAMIWTAPHSMITMLKQLSPSEFVSHLQLAFGYRLGRFNHIAERFVFPLRMVKTEKNVDGCVLLLGNAAHTIHPIAAQGFNLSLFEVAIFVEHLLKTLSLGHSLTTLLSDISPLMTAQQDISIRLSHLLAKAFTKESGFGHLALQFGMMGLNLLPSLKKQFIHRVMGRYKTLPRLLLNTEYL